MADTGAAALRAFELRDAIFGADSPLTQVASEALHYLRQRQMQLRHERSVTRDVYDKFACKFNDTLSDPTIACALVDPFRRRQYVVKVRVEVHKSPTAWTSELHTGDVRTLLGLDIVNKTYREMTYRETEDGQPRDGKPCVYFYRWAGLHLPLPS